MGYTILVLWTQFMYRYGVLGSFARDFGCYHFKYSCSTLQKFGARDAGVLQNLGGARSPAALPRAAGLARFLPPQYLQPLETFVGPMWLCGTGPSGDTLH